MMMKLRRIITGLILVTQTVDKMEHEIHRRSK